MPRPISVPSVADCFKPRTATVRAIGSADQERWLQSRISGVFVESSLHPSLRNLCFDSFVERNRFR